MLPHNAADFSKSPIPQRLAYLKQEFGGQGILRKKRRAYSSSIRQACEQLPSRPRLILLFPAFLSSASNNPVSLSWLRGFRLPAPNHRKLVDTGRQNKKEYQIFHNLILFVLVGKN